MDKATNMDQQIIDGVILRLSAAGEPLSPRTKLKDDLGFDSLKIVELIVALEEELDICIDDSDLEPSRLQTVDDLYTLLAGYRS